MKKTDWDAYYKRPYKTASYSRSITSRLLLKNFKKHQVKKNPTIMEIGGANSCFYDVIQEKIQPAEFIVMDNNQLGLDKFAERLKKRERNSVSLINNDILNPIPSKKADIVFSVGLVEHFSEEDTEKAILNHFEYVNSGGIVIITFPTPTFLYKATRKIAELTKQWIFHDERPITMQEANSIFDGKACILSKKIVWPMFLTQAHFVLKKN